MSTCAIDIRSVSKSFAQLKALDDISLQINQGEFFGLLGPNGAGKSTMINAMAGLLNVDTGHISILGADVKGDFRQARKQLGVVPQELVMDPFFNVRETLELQSGYYGIRNNQAWIDELLQQLNLSDKADTNTRKLSGGMKRRLLIAQALVHKPAVLVLDEPTAGVDVELRQTMWKFIRELHQQGHTVVLTTHYLEEAEQLCERIAIIDHGKLVTLETKEQLLARGLGSKLLVRSRQPISHIPENLQDRVLLHHGNKLELGYHKDQDSIMSLLDKLREAGTEIEHVSVQSDSLEDVFVRLTTKPTVAQEAR